MQQLFGRYKAHGQIATDLADVENSLLTMSEERQKAVQFRPQNPLGPGMAAPCAFRSRGQKREHALKNCLRKC